MAKMAEPTAHEENRDHILSQCSVRDTEIIRAANLILDYVVVIRSRVLLSKCATNCIRMEHFDEFCAVSEGQAFEGIL